jgi:threonyl-tRNA synthetase
MIEDLEDGEASMYEQGEFKDLCVGPHIPRTGMIKALKLTKIAGAYWRADSKNKQLQRIYGITFPDKKQLKEHLELIEQAKLRDHRTIGRDLGLYSFHDEAPGMPFFHDKGSYIWNKLADFMKEAMIERNYEINKTPLILNKQLWLQSGHWDHYKENMYFTKIDSPVENYAVKPMNCPGNILIYKTESHSYRELPIRAGEFGLVHRHELSGVLSGLFRVRCFTQDDAHVFCMPEQLKHETKELIDFVDYIYKTFGFEYAIELSTRPEKSLGQGNDELWELAENTLKDVLEESKIKYKLNPGDGAFYGPKIDFHLKDAIGRTWQCGTIQLDFQMPEKFDLTYEGSDGKKHRPVMLHRAIYGSFERFLGILVEHYAGKFPMWLSPNQIILLPIADRHEKHCNKLAAEFRKAGLRTEVDARSESMKKKVRDAQMQKYNLMLTIGDKEAENNTLAIRTLDGDVKFGVSVDDFIKKIKENIKKKEQNIKF